MSEDSGAAKSSLLFHREARATVSRRALLVTGAALGTGVAAVRAQSDSKIVEIADNETATIDGRLWDKPFVGGGTVDAVHRSVLLRFPQLAGRIAAALDGGCAIARAELLVAYDGYELVPLDYACRPAVGRKLWTEDPPTWHIQAWPLLRPWFADPALGPTFNASVNGHRFWSLYGAAGAGDRLSGLLAPQELSHNAREARIDVSALLLTDVLATDPGERLRRLEQCGFLLRKVETYDSRYRIAGDAYEWAMPTGGHGLKFMSPRLVVTCRPIERRPGVTVRLPRALSRDELVQPGDGVATAVLPSAEQVAERVGRALRVGNDRRQAWENQRIDELLRLGGDSVSAWADINGPKGYAAYQARIRLLLLIPPRYWQGWQIQDDLLVYHIFGAALPPPVQEHLKEYWRGWLMPDLATNVLVHPQGREAIDYWKRTKDWRGRASFFRGGYNYVVSTQNFNHTAAMGALLGGAFIDSDNAIADGRHGLERLLLRFWGFLDGSTQEMLDHYYLSITLSAQKMFADFAPTPIDRLMGRILVDRTMEMLITVYHPELRRFVASSGRAHLPGVLLCQEGIHGVLHTLSKRGVVQYLDKPTSSLVHGMPLWGSVFPPGRVAMQSLASPWAPRWMTGLVDDKPIPFEETSAETTRGHFKPPLWHRTYLGRWHALASADIRGGTFDLVGQWMRRARASEALEDIGTLTARYVVNGADLAATEGGNASHGGVTLIYQSRNRAIVFAKPHGNRKRFMAAAGADGVASLATVIGLWNFAAPPTWKFFVDDKQVGVFPHRLGAGQLILIDDGVSYLGIIPLPSADLGRDVEVEIGFGGGGKTEPNGAVVAPALTISMFNLRRDKPVPPAELDLEAISSRSFGGFVLEMGDAAQYGSFGAFARHMRANRLTAQWHRERGLLEVAYQSGADVMEAAFSSEFAQPVETYLPLSPGAQERAIPYRRLNGQWPYLPSGVERDTTWAQQGTTGRLEKNGAVLLTEPGRKAYLLADPLSGAVVGYNPLPDAQAWELITREGVRMRADGKVGLLRVEYRPWSGECDVDYAPKPDQDGEEMARTLTFSGLEQPPVVRLNGRRVDPAVRPPSDGAGRRFQIALV
jgi:hypothetical protein